MVEIVFVNLCFNRTIRAWNEEHLATFHMDGSHLSLVRGDGSRFQFRDARFIDGGGNIVTIDDGERWAQMLPRLFELSRIDVRVTEIERVP